MSDQSSRLALPYLAAGQAQKHVTVNESLQRLDALVQLSVASATTGTEPRSPTDGVIYVLPGGKTGSAWAAMADGALGYYVDGAWQEIAPREGWLAFARDTNSLLLYDGTAWITCPSGLASDAETRAQSNALKALTPANLAARACFSAHKNNTDQ